MAVGPIPTLYDIPKACKCGKRWVGKSFQPLNHGETEREWDCDDCIAAWEARVKQFTEYRPSTSRPAATDIRAPEEPKQEREPWDQR